MEPITLSFISKRSVTSAKFEGQQDKIFNERAAFVARFSIDNNKTINQPVILSEENREAVFAVEVLPSEERGKTKAPKRRRDMARSLGGF